MNERQIWKKKLTVHGENLFSSGAHSTFLHGVALIPVWISNYIHYKVWYEITYLFPNFNDGTVAVWEWICTWPYIYIYIYIIYIYIHNIDGAQCKSVCVWRDGAPGWCGAPRQVGGLARGKKPPWSAIQHALIRHYLLLFVLPEICRVSLLISKIFVHNWYWLR